MLLTVYIFVLIISITYVTFPNSYIINERNYSFSKIVNVDKNNLFVVIADIQNYPNIFPDNYISVIISNQTDNIVFSKDTIQESGIQTTLDIKRTIILNEQQEIEILNGDAEGTKILINFSEINSNTRIDVNIDMKFSGILTPFSYLPKHNLDSAMNTILITFIEKVNSQ